MSGSLPGTYDGTGESRNGTPERNKTAVTQNVPVPDPYNQPLPRPQDLHGPLIRHETSLPTSPTVHVLSPTHQQPQSLQDNFNNLIHHQHQYPQQTPNTPYHLQHGPQQPPLPGGPPYSIPPLHVTAHAAAINPSQYPHGPTEVGFPITYQMPFQPYFPPPFPSPFPPNLQPAPAWPGINQQYVQQLYPGNASTVHPMSNLFPPGQGTSVPMSQGSASYSPPQNGRPTQVVEERGPSRPGPKGGYKCARCRKQKQGKRAPCITDPDDPHGPCIPCKKAGSYCGPITLPSSRRTHRFPDTETDQVCEAWMEHLTPEGIKEVHAAMEKAALLERNHRASNTQMGSIGTVSVGASSHNSNLPGIGIPPTGRHGNFMGGGSSAQREPSGQVYPILAHSATWVETDRPRVHVSEANIINPTGSIFANPSKRNRESFVDVIGNPSHDDDKSDTEGKSPETRDKTVENMSSIISGPLPPEKRRRVTEIVESLIPQNSASQTRSSAAPPIKSPTNSQEGDPEEFNNALEDNLSDLDFDDDSEYLHPNSSESPAVPRTPAPLQHWPPEYLVTSPSDSNGGDIPPRLTTDSPPLSPAT